MRRAPDLNRIRLVLPDIVGVNHLKTPVSFTLLTMTVASKYG
jgi:hypothetical protein